jgi:NAD-dependent deacetylase
VSVADDLRCARDLLARAERVVVFTGAGVSAESGVPTFRGPGGLWKSFRPEQLATPQAFARDPRLVWEWYGWRREIVAECRPNLAHVALGRWMLLREGVTLVTQNVDDLHERGAEDAVRGLIREGRIGGGGEPAGGARAAATRVAPIRLHGSLFHARCTRCGGERAHRDPIDAATAETLPRCACGGLLRPAVVWFGESLPEDALARSYRLAGEAGVCLVIGTTGAVHPAAGVVHETLGAGGAVIVVDPGETAYDDVAAVRLWGAAGELVPDLLAAT